jgi:pSer/pThr/pTyr-binding forkhead associated (FHA) protein
LRNLVTGVPHLILPGVHLVGRSEEADILLADQSISRRHARIYNTEEGLMVEDLGSSNGTYVQGEVARKTEPKGAVL